MRGNLKGVQAPLSYPHVEFIVSSMFPSSRVFSQRPRADMYRFFGGEGSLLSE